MKRIVISGPSGTGKTTYLKSIASEINTYDELPLDKNSKIGKYYELAKRKNQRGKNLFIELMMDKKANEYLNIKKDTVFDRSIIDYIVAAELRVLPHDKKAFVNINNKFLKYMKDIEEIKPSYIILKTDFNEFKNRILTRGREDEVANMNNDDSWYRNYHSKYVDTLVWYLEKYKIEYAIIDTTDYSIKDTKKALDKIIFL